MELLTAGTIAPGVVAFYRVPPADVVPDAVTIEADPQNPDVERDRQAGRTSRNADVARAIHRA